jgi:hypothetical protein
MLKYISQKSIKVYISKLKSEKAHVINDIKKDNFYNLKYQLINILDIHHTLLILKKFATHNNRNVFRTKNQIIY